MHGLRMWSKERLHKIICYTDLKHTFQVVQSVDVTTLHFDNKIVVIRQYMASD